VADILNIQESLERGLTALGTVLLSGDDLLALAEEAARRDMAVDTVEGYILKNGDEIAAPEYSLYGPDDEFEHQPWVAKVAHALAEVKALINRARSDGQTVVFQAWLGQHQA
jgi:hypothetical protein